MQSDDQLIESYLEGDESAISLLVDRYLEDVYTFALKLTNDPQMAEDIVQESFIKAWKNIRRFIPGNSFKSWLFSITHNTAIDSLRKKQPLTLAHDVADPAPLQDELLSKAEDAQYLEQLLGSINEDHREVLTLHSNGFTFKEIGELLKKPLHTIKSQHRRALIALQRVHQKSPEARI